VLELDVSMSDLRSYNAAEDIKRYLAFRFCVAAIILVTFLLVLAMSLLSYHQIREQGLDSNLQQFAKQLNAQYFHDAQSNSISIIVAQLKRDWPSMSQIRSVKSAALFDNSEQLLWNSGNSQAVLSAPEQSAFQALIIDGRDSVIIDHYGFRLTSLGGIFSDESAPIVGLVVIRNRVGNNFGVLRVTRDYDYVLRGAQQAVSKIAVYVLGANLFLFTVLLLYFRRSLKTIDGQESQMVKQILSLSKLNLVNTTMRKSMKTASSRAVELNEQFLRRVGADLHDGPAQLIGYAVLRLDRISKDESSSGLKQEFHVVREALDSALTEIRGISSGLVLPELEQMTMEECFSTAVTRHSQNSEIVVDQYYKNLPSDISLPIKICAFRFVQEGLNNAHRHARAKQCRVYAYAKDDILHLSLKDDGIGFRKSQLQAGGAHLGLMGLKDRIESLGGQFLVNSKLGAGTVMKATIALHDDE
jgi:signal transduction histidine kinase